MKVVLDCNVIISAGLNSGVCRDLVDEVILHHELILSPGIISEYQRVIPRFKLNAEVTEKLKEIVTELLMIATLIDPLPFNVSLIDNDDEVYLTTALTAKVDVLITGNRKHFPFPQYEGIFILSPGEFLRMDRGWE
ncbi:MAG: putative toxin-antitoxin system toxin component, PIN family [Candidatus Magnetobacterium sp. LHC-1]|uniref:Toxin-antitoxin system toxin component, PIN family n=1 Tax=Candidatus Magnetobacterium casense TaxID=1455061 RepID=A0ABS6RU24_9BACT|nr:putative toxin-antitoxin system toxin component, PIN family [Candidatus Magnetobacterium casensis]MBF0608136.1 putative toxin-antitoxin system toxin component, PIN family [Nitrospirota bacterium]MBV6340129.1 putative toxin-antitoxin system toxin component, PIN family [Candidatus Magnetobacterium casensis]